MSEGKPSRPPSNELREDEDGVPEGVPSSNTRSEDDRWIAMGIMWRERKGGFGARVVSLQEFDRKFT